MAEDRLARYRAIRDFEATPEPAGDERPEPAGAARFVVQEHHATSLHWDLRLERDGTLVSWAVPKGIPADPAVNHLAVRTEDHPLEYLTFAGDIPTGNYGAGRMGVWDSGTYDVVKWDEREVMVVLHGGRVSGRHVLFRTGGNQWMIHRMDPPQDPDRQAWPGWSAFGPMVAEAGPMPAVADLDRYAFEVDWGGTRALARVDGGRVAVHLPGDERDLIRLVPELRPLGASLGTTEVVVDGSLIVAGAGGRPDGVRLAERLGAASERVTRRLAAASPVTYLIFDLLWEDGHPHAELPYDERRARLEALGLAGAAWQVVPAHRGEGPALLDAAAALGLPGVVAKERASPYRPGPAGPAWIAVAAPDGG